MNINSKFDLPDLLFLYFLCFFPFDYSLNYLTLFEFQNKRVFCEAKSIAASPQSWDESF
jgi:hypothetical protein